MAYPVIVDKAGKQGGTAKNHSFQVPPGVQAGDLIIASVSARDAAAPATPFGMPAGWTSLVNSTTNTDLATAVWWRIATGAESLVAFTSVNNVNTTTLCYLIRGHDPAVAPAFVGSADFNPPALTPSWGAQDTLWMVVSFSKNQQVTANKYPTGYTYLYSWGTGGTSGSRITSFWRNNHVATEDPSAVGYDGSTDGRARTLGIKPVPPAPIDAAFDWNATGEPLEVQFLDMSSGGPPITWSWNFGDGATSTAQDPRHIYATPGDKTVTLIASNGAITDTYVEVITVDAPAGRPDLDVVVGEQNLTCFMTSARWQTGRESWLQPVEPANATLTFEEDVSVEIGDKVSIACQYGLLWTGYVTSVAVEQDPTGRYVTTLTATDVIGLFGQSDLVKVTIAAGDILAKVNALALLDGRTVTTQTGPAVDATWPSLAAQTSYEGTAMAALQQYEDSSNAILVCLPRDVVVAQKRVALPDPYTYLPLELDGPDCPALWSKQRATVRVLNDFKFLDTAGAIVADYQYTDSIARYGRRAFSAPVLVTTMAQQAWMDVASEPRYIVPEGLFHIYDPAQSVQLLQPLDFVTFAGEDWQVMRVTHEVTPSSWDMTLAVDATQNVFSGEPDQTPDTPPPEGTAVVTTSGTSSTDSYVLLHSNGSKLGAGADTVLPVGYWQGSKYRSLVAFPGFPVPANVLSVKKATLTLRTSTQVKVGFGSSPKVKVQAIKENWSEGGASSPSSGNAVKWPGPATSTTGQVTKSLTRNQSTDVTINVTSLVQAMFNSGTLSLSRGFRLISTNEGSSAPTTEFKSQDGGPAVKLSVDWLVSV